MLTPCRRALSTVARITSGSPAWKPQATLADVMTGISASSAPRSQSPKLSPRSELKSMSLKGPPPSARGRLQVERQGQRAARIHRDALPPVGGGAVDVVQRVGVPGRQLRRL